MRSRNDKKVRLVELGAERLAEAILELAHLDERAERIVDLLLGEGDPAGLAGKIGRRIAGLKRARRFVHYRQSFELARQLEDLVGAIERLLSTDPLRAFDLLDRFVTTDAHTFERIDDSSGSVADVYRHAAVLWLDAAAAARQENLDGRDWFSLVLERGTEDGYGVRENLFRRAQKLLSEHELRRLAKHFEDMAAAVPKADEDDFDARFARSSALCHLSLVAEALGDPALYERSVELHSGGLNRLQLEDVARRYLESGDPETAIERLRRLPDTSGLLAQCYAAAGRTDEQLDVLWEQLEQTLSSSVFEEILGVVDQSQADKARQRAIELARSGGETLAAVGLLLSLGEVSFAEQRALADSEDFAVTYWPSLKRLLDVVDEKGSDLLAVLLLRSLLLEILESGRTKAYGHAGRYFTRLQKLDASIESYRGLPDHDELVGELREHHARKISFWRRVEA